MIDFAAVSLLAAQAVSAASVSQWQWDAETPICAVRHETTSETIKVSRTPANDETQLEITVPKPRDAREGRFRDGSIDLFPAGKSSANGSFVKKGEKLKVYAVTPDPSFIQSFSSASALAVSIGTAAGPRVTIGSAKEAVEALRGCEDRKMAAWGIDPAAWRALKSRPFPLAPVRDRFAALDYPEDALRAHIQFDAIIRLDVGPDGSVQQCRGLNSGSYKGFETASCAVLKRARFRPALDSASNPVSAPIVFDVVFRVAS